MAKMTKKKTQHIQKSIILVLHVYGHNRKIMTSSKTQINCYDPLMTRIITYQYNVILNFYTILLDN
jgi:hypothetical protein